MHATGHGSMSASPPALAEKYGIAVVPTIYAVDRDGAVIEQLA